MENQDNQQQNLPADGKQIDEILQDSAQETKILPPDNSWIDEVLHESVPEPEALSSDDNWIDEVLQIPQQNTEILPDTDAIAAAGLADPAEVEVDMLIQEALAQITQKTESSADPMMDATQVVEQPYKDAEYRDAFGDGEDLEAIFNTAPYVEEEAHISEEGGSLPPELKPNAEKVPPAPPARKKRPRYKAKDNLFGLSHILVTAVWLVLIVFIGVTLANVLWICASDVLAFGRDNREVSITIEDNDTMEDISKKLQENGLIRYPNLFSMYAELTGAREEIGAGTFTLNTMYDYHALVNFMNSNSAEREIVEVVIPEGYNCSQLFALLEENGVCTVADLEAYAAEGELDDYWFLEDVDRGDRYCLEGFLFPDTYEFYVNDDPRRVLEKMLDDFDYRFTDEMRSNLIALNDRLTEWMEDYGYEQEYIDDHLLSLRDLVTVASLIEEETANTLESYTISSVIYNRLYRWGDTPSFLNIDAAIIYALGEHKEELTVSDLQIDSPYNTYTHTGLTPGPITNPGLHSLNAALDPDDTDYFYYAMDPDIGAHHFSEDEDAHNEFLASLEEE